MAIIINDTRYTKAVLFSTVKAALELVSADEVNDVPVTELVNFIDHEMELLAKKSTAPRKESAVQKENAVYRELIVSYLRGMTEPVTCTEIGNAIPEFSGFNNQKISALMRQLVENGTVKKNKVKGKTVFELA